MASLQLFFPILAAHVFSPVDPHKNHDLSGFVRKKLSVVATDQSAFTDNANILSIFHCAHFLSCIEINHIFLEFAL